MYENAPNCQVIALHNLIKHGGVDGTADALLIRALSRQLISARQIYKIPVKMSRWELRKD